MLIQFTFQDLMFFLVCALGIAAGILLLSILWNIKKVVGILRPLIETNQEAIKTTIRTMPGICENVEQISINVRDTTDKLKLAKGSIELAGDVVENMKDTPDSTAYFHIIEEVLQIIYRTFFSSK